MSRMADSSIEFVGVSKSYGAHLVLDDLSFRVSPGSVTGLLGPNGSGKTTALRLLLGLERPDRGRLLVGGCQFRDLPHPYHEVGALLDASWVHPNRSAQDHLTWIAQASALSTGAVEPALAQVGLAEVAHQLVGTFSLGMRQRLGIASTILGDPAVLIYDEPLNGLDHAGVEWVRGFFLRQAAAGRTVLFSSHMLSEVEQTADEVVIMARGSVLYAGETSGLATGGGGVEFEVVTSDDALQRVNELAANRGWGLATSTSRRDSQVFSVAGVEVAEASAALHAAGVVVRRIHDHSSLADAYARLTADRADFVRR